MPSPPIGDQELDAIARDMNRSRTKKRILVLGAMVASFAALAFAMVYSFSNP